MEVTEQNMITLAGYLQQTIDSNPETRRAAEKFLQGLEINENYPILLLSVVGKDQVEHHIRLAAAVSFKNYVKRNWGSADEGNDRIHASDRMQIKTHIVALMLRSPQQIQRQLSDSVSIIGRYDFPDQWPTLIDEMVSHFATGDFGVINGVLQTAHSIFKRYRHEFKSQKLWTEIKYVLDKFAKPLTDLFIATMDLAGSNAGNPDALKVIFGSLVCIAKIFYSLNYQDLPEFFEDNIDIWMPRFLQLLTADEKCLVTQQSDEVGLLEQLKSQICDNVDLYAQKYDEEFQKYLPDFVKAIWHLLTTTSMEIKQDLLVSNAIHFLCSVAQRLQYKSLFEDEQVLSSICSKVIIPNMTLRQVDEELFEDDPDEYVRRDIEGSDVDTRRRAASDLVRALSKHFETQITQIFGSFIMSMLESYNQNPQANWKDKDIAIYLVTSMAVKAQTARLGTTQTNQLVNVADFFVQHVRDDLSRDKLHMILKADAIKYVMVFRNQIPPDVLFSILAPLVALIASPNYVIHTYAASTIERILTMKEVGTDKPVVTQQALQPILEGLLKNLLLALQQQCSVENEYIMKAVMRTLHSGQEAVLPHLPMLINGLTSRLMAVAKNPSKPHFNHYLFETICVSIRVACKNDKTNVAGFESTLFPIFQQLLQQDVQEFIPYVFQLLSLMLEIHDPPVPEAYMALFPHLLSPVLWERPGNIRPLVQLIQAFIERASPAIQAMDKIPALLGVFQKLLASKANDHEGLYIVESLVEHMDGQFLEPYMKQIFTLMFQRLTSSKTVKLIKSLLVFFSVFIHKRGANGLVQVIDSIQPNMFGMVLERLFIPEVQKVSGAISRKLCAVGMIRLLCECDAMKPPQGGPYSQFWLPLLVALVQLFEAPEDTTIPNDEHFVDVEDTPGYQASFSQLQFANKKVVDPLSDVQDPRILLAQSLAGLAPSLNMPSLMTFITEGTPPEVCAFIGKYFQLANVQLL